MKVVNVLRDGRTVETLAGVTLKAEDAPGIYAWLKGKGVR